jgi:hypothetical protein
MTAFEDDPYFANPYKRIKAKLADQKTASVSTLWPASLKQKLAHYPKLSSAPGGRGRCDACNKRSHATTLSVFLRGKPYSRRTYRHAAKHSSLSGDDEVTLTLGTTCAQRVTVYHALEHHLLKVYKACSRKVANLEGKCAGETEVVCAIVDDRAFIGRLFADFESLIAASDKLRK